MTDANDRGDFRALFGGDSKTASSEHALMNSSRRVSKERELLDGTDCFGLRPEPPMLLAKFPLAALQHHSGWLEDVWNHCLCHPGRAQ